MPPAATRLLAKIERVFASFPLAYYVHVIRELDYNEKRIGVHDTCYGRR